MLHGSDRIRRNFIHTRGDQHVSPPGTGANLCGDVRGGKIDPRSQGFGKIIDILHAGGIDEHIRNVFRGCHDPTTAVKDHAPPRRQRAAAAVLGTCDRKKAATHRGVDVDQPAAQEQEAHTDADQ